MHTTQENKEVIIWCRNLKDIMMRNIKKLHTNYLENTEYLEACLGGDHGHSTFFF